MRTGDELQILRSLAAMTDVTVREHESIRPCVFLVIYDHAKFGPGTRPNMCRFDRS